MKKLNFQKLNFRQEDVLTRTEMKKILGGYGGGENDCNSDCSGSCTLKCDDGSTSSGTCGWSHHHSKCTCGGVC